MLKDGEAYSYQLPFIILCSLSLIYVLSPTCFFLWPAPAKFLYIFKHPFFIIKLKPEDSSILVCRIFADTKAASRTDLDPFTENIFYSFYYIFVFDIIEIMENYIFRRRCYQRTYK